METGTPCTLCPLRRQRGFKPLDEPTLAALQALKRGEVTVPAGGAILSEGETSCRLYTLLSGWAFRHKSLPDGRRQIMNILLPGDLIGLQGELMAAPAHSIEAVTEVRLCAFARSSLWDIFRGHPQLGYDLTWLAAHEERLLDEALLSVGRRNAIERIAMVLVHLYRRAAAVGLERDGTVPFPLTQTHLADLMGLSPVHVNRTLQVLRKRQLIRLHDRRLAIGDLAALRRVAEYWERPAAQRPLL
jgi:CRP-like cAMP-binding protein